jgi:hypothetical protein
MRWTGSAPVFSNKATADGKVTAKERARIAKAQDREGRRIIRETHDKQTAK